MKNASNNWITLKGLIVPVRWDKNGVVKGIAIAGHDERNYPVLMDKVGRRMMSSLHEEVIVMGMHLKKDKRDILKVKRFNKDSI